MRRVTIAETFSQCLIFLNQSMLGRRLCRKNAIPGVPGFRLTCKPIRPQSCGANNTLLRARLHSFDNRTRDRFLGLWYESYSAQTERDKKLGEIAAQYNWCRVVAAPLQLWFTRLTEQRAREAAAGAKADLRLKRRMFDWLLARCQAVTVAEEKADRLTKGWVLAPLDAALPGRG